MSCKCLAAPLACPGVRASRVRQAPPPYRSGGPCSCPATTAKGRERPERISRSRRMLLPCRHERAENIGNDEGTSGWVNADVAADALGVSSRSVRNYILNGDSVARKAKEGVNERYVVSVESLYALRGWRKHEGKLRGNRRRTSRQLESSGQGTAEVMRETAVDMMREILSSLETYIAQNAELRARLELTERAESALREELEEVLD
jgi:hypothetical protein